MAKIKRVNPIAYPLMRKRYVPFDQSSCHKAYTPDPLRINLHPSGEQPDVHDTKWTRIPHKLVDSDGVCPKAQKQC